MRVNSAVGARVDSVRVCGGRVGFSLVCEGNSGNGNGNNKDNSGSGNNGNGNSGNNGNGNGNGKGNGNNKKNSKSDGTDDAGYGNATNATNAEENNSQNQCGILFPVQEEVSATEADLIARIKTTGKEKKSEK